MSTPRGGPSVDGMNGVRTDIRIVRKYATCLDCPSRWDGANALAVAARHAAAHGHTVTGTCHTEHSYMPLCPAPSRMPTRQELLNRAGTEEGRS